MSREAKARPQVSLAENRRRRHASSHLSLCTACVPKDKIKVRERVRATYQGTLPPSGERSAARDWIACGEFSFFGNPSGYS